MNNIYAEQNTDKFIKLLAAQRHIYTKAKKVRANRTYFSLFLIIASLSASIWNNEWSPYLSMLAGLWTFALLLLKNYEKTTITQGAKIQEEFDTTLFGLPWNNILVGSKITREIITEADSNFKGTRSRLQNWYANYNKDSHIQNIIHCQRANLSWDWRLRQAYCNFILLMISILFFGEAIYALVQNKSLYEYVVELFIPSIPIIGIGLESIIEHKVLVKDKKEKEQEVSSLLDGNHVDMETARRLQDIIFTFRTSTAVIPEYFYKIFWKRFDNTMHNSID